MSKGLLSALLVSIVLAVCLSLLPDRALERFGNDAFGVDAKRDVPVIKMDGIVDQLSTLSLHGHLQKVTYASDKLTVWLAVPAVALQQARTWQDIYQIDYRFLTGQAPYSAVEVRVVTTEAHNDVQFVVIAHQQDLAGGPAPDSPRAAAFVQQKMDVIGKASTVRN